MNSRITRPPARVRNAKLDNLTLIPGSMLPYIESCQWIANRLPTGGVLIVLPVDNPVQKRSLLTVAQLLARDGHQVSVIPAAELSRRIDSLQRSLSLD